MKYLKILKYAITVVIINSMQVSLCNYLTIGNIKPNLVIPFVVSVAIVNGPVTGGIVGLACGIFMDALSSGTTIINSLTYMYLAVISGILNINYFRNNAGVVMLFTFIGTILCELCVHFVHFAIWGSSNIFVALINPIFLIALYTLIYTIPVYSITKKLFRSKNKEV